jgi:hypothetical protein
MPSAGLKNLGLAPNLAVPDIVPLIEPDQQIHGPTKKGISP